MPDVDGIAEDSDWEELDDKVKELSQRASDWADSVRGNVKGTRGELPPGCVSRLREKWRPLRRVAELADATSDTDGDTFWTDTVWEMANEDLEDMKAQREAGLTRQTPNLVLLQDLAAVWPKDEPFNCPPRR